MAEVLPFEGIRYNPEKVNQLADVITPPFDVISNKEQDRYYESSPFNIIRLILGKTTAYDTRSNNPHSRAADYMSTWLSDGIFVQDREPAFYLTTLDFNTEGKAYKRYGLIARVKLSPYDAGIILPHERTFTNVKSERLALMKACHANFSPIFSMVPDDDGVLFDTMRQLTDSVGPSADFTARDGCQHKLWRLVGPSVMLKLTDTIRSRKLYIADGHHRYETALNYRNWMHETIPGLSVEHPANFVMMYLSSMADPGLVIRPAHRLLKEVPQSALDQLLEKARPQFQIETISFREDERGAALRRLVANMQGDTGRSSIGMYMRGRKTFYRLTMKKTEPEDDLFGPDLSDPLRQLDVMVLTRLFLTEFLSFDQARLDNEKLIAYTTDAREAVARVTSGDFDVCFLLNPTSVQQVRGVADSGLVMPRKATYFYPKVTTGLVVHRLTA